MSRYETYLRKIAGEDVDISNMPEPSDRYEYYLKQIAENGGGSVDPEEIAEIVTDWLDDHVDPETGYVIDNILLVEGAAADAKKVGDELADVKSAISDNSLAVDTGFGNATVKSVDVANIPDALAGYPVQDLVISVGITQSGTGKPSSQNVRAISGHTGASLVSSPTDDASDGTTTEITWEDDAGTVWGGTLTLKPDGSAVLVKEYTLLDTANLSWTGPNSSGRFDSGNLSSLVKTAGRITVYSDVYHSITNRTGSQFNSGALDGEISMISSGSQPYIGIKDSQFTAAADLKAYLANHQIVAKLATPVTYTLTSIIPIKANTHIWADVGKINSITYIKNPSAESEALIGNGGYGLSSDALLYLESIPTYYKTPAETPTSFGEAYSYLEDKINSIPKRGKSFIYITDTHWAGNEKHSTQLINYIRKRTGIRKVLFGGDILGYAADKYQFVKKGGDYLLQSRQAFEADYIPCVGDHDNNTSVSNASDDTFVPYTETAKMFVADLQRKGDFHYCDVSEKLAEYATPDSADFNDVMEFFKTVYYTDDTENKIRYIVLNSGTGSNAYGAMYRVFGSSGSDVLRLQYDWVAETLMSTPNGYDVIFLSHKGNSSYAGTSAAALNSLITSFQCKNANASPYPSSSMTPAIDTWWPTNTSYDFSNAPDINRIITINGHSHKDELAYFGVVNGTYYNTQPAAIASGSTIIQGGTTTANQIPIIITSTDSLGNAESSSPSMTQGTVTEQCFDVITLVDDGIVLTRIGAGDDRRLYISKS